MLRLNSPSKKRNEDQPMLLYYLAFKQYNILLEWVIDPLIYFWSQICPSLPGSFSSSYLWAFAFLICKMDIKCLFVGLHCGMNSISKMIHRLPAIFKYFANCVISIFLRFCKWDPGLSSTAFSTICNWCSSPLHSCHHALLILCTVDALLIGTCVTFNEAGECSWKTTGLLKRGLVSGFSLMTCW